MQLTKRRKSFFVMDLKIQKVLDIFLEKGIEAYVVGGYVRDSYLCVPTFDVDIAVQTSLENLENMVSSFVPTLRFHSLFFSIEPYHFTLTPFRIEGEYTDKRKPLVVKETDSMYMDSKRRDFTINALYQSKDGFIWDFHGGLKDLQNKTIRTIGDPFKRLHEDPLRLLRALRFASLLHFQIETNLEKAIQSCLPLLQNISYTRKREEIEKLYRGHPQGGFGLVNQYHLGSYIGAWDPLLYTPTILGLLPQLGKEYPLSKKEQKVREKMLHFIEGPIRDIDIVENLLPLEVWENICFLKGISFDLFKERYQNLKVHSLKELEFPYFLFENCPSTIPGKREEVLHLILEGKLENTKHSIRQYLTHNDNK